MMAISTLFARVRFQWNHRITNVTALVVLRGRRLLTIFEYFPPYGIAGEKIICVFRPWPRTMYGGRADDDGSHRCPNVEQWGVHRGDVGAAAYRPDTVRLLSVELSWTLLLSSKAVHNLDRCGMTAGGGVEQQRHCHKTIQQKYL